MKEGQDRSPAQYYFYDMTTSISSCEPGSVELVSGSKRITAFLDAICTLEAATFGVPWKRIDFVNDLESADSCCMALLSGGILVGYLFAKAVLDEICLNKICVAASWQGRGFGKTLLAGFIDSVKKSSARVFLEVDSTNTPAVRLYSGFGFRTVRIRNAIYESGADGLEMVLEL